MWQHSFSGCSLPVTRPSINHSSSIFAVFAGVRWNSGILFSSYKWRQTVQINKNQQGTHKLLGPESYLRNPFTKTTEKSWCLSFFYTISSQVCWVFRWTPVSCRQVTFIKMNNVVGLGKTEKCLQTTSFGKVVTLCRHSKLSGFIFIVLTSLF